MDSFCCGRRRRVSLGWGGGKRPQIAARPTITGRLRLKGTAVGSAGPHVPAENLPKNIKFGERKRSDWPRFRKSGWQRVGERDVCGEAAAEVPPPAAGGGCSIPVPAVTPLSPRASPPAPSFLAATSVPSRRRTPNPPSTPQKTGLPKETTGKMVFH